MMKNETRVLKSALPLYLEADGNRAVLLLHGYTGYPADMHDLAVRIHSEGFTVAVPRLPGHGTNTEDFLRSDWRQWYCHVRNAYLNLHSRFQEVCIAGLSMGGVLALLLAEEFEPEKVILLAPAMAVQKPVFYLTPVLRFIVPRIKRGSDPGNETDAERMTMKREYWSYHYSSKLANLNRLMRMAKRRLRDVVCPVYIMVSEKDRTVPLKAGAIVSDRVSGEVTRLTLKESPHVFFDGPEKDFVIGKVADWLTEPV